MNPVVYPPSLTMWEKHDLLVCRDVASLGGVMVIRKYTFVVPLAQTGYSRLRSSPSVEVFPGTSQAGSGTAHQWIGRFDLQAECSKMPTGRWHVPSRLSSTLDHRRIEDDSGNLSCYAKQNAAKPP